MAEICFGLSGFSSSSYPPASAMLSATTLTLRPITGAMKLGTYERRLMMTQIKPDYYNSNGFEVIDFIDAFNLSFSLGNVIKYIVRAGNKQGEDRITALYKALYYLKHEIEIEEKS